MGHNNSGPGLGGGAGSGAGAGNPLLGNFTYRFLTATTVYAQFTDVNGKDLSTVQTAAAAAATNHTIASLFPSPPAGATGAYFSALEPFWWNNSAGAATPAQLYSEQGTFALGSASSSNLPALLDFDPYDLEPYVWLDCTDKATMFTAETANTLAGATPVAATNDTVRVMYDKGSLGLVLRQATAGSRPAYDSTLFGGAGGLVFDGSADFLKDANCDNTIPKARTVFTVLNATNFTAANYIGGSSAFGTNSFGFSLTITNGYPTVDFQSVGSYSGAAGSQLTAATDTGLMFAISCDAGTNARIRLSTTDADLGVNTGMGTTAIAVITDYTLGGNDNSGYFLGSIGCHMELPAMNRLNQTKLKAWAKNRFGL